MVLATMPPLLCAMANAGLRGVLVKSAVVMGQLGQASRVAFDKTGTLTQGTPRLADIRPMTGSGLRDDDLLRLAAAVEYPSAGPRGRGRRPGPRGPAHLLDRSDERERRPEQGIAVAAAMD